MRRSWKHHDNNEKPKRDMVPDGIPVMGWKCIGVEDAQCVVGCFTEEKMPDKLKDCDIVQTFKDQADMYTELWKL